MNLKSKLCCWQQTKHNTATIWKRNMIKNITGLEITVGKELTSASMKGNISIDKNIKFTPQWLDPWRATALYSKPDKSIKTILFAVERRYDSTYKSQERVLLLLSESVLSQRERQRNILA